MKKKRIRAAVVIAVVLVFRGGFCRRKYVVNSTAYILDTDLGTGGIYQGTREGSFLLQAARIRSFLSAANFINVC